MQQRFQTIVIKPVQHIALTSKTQTIIREIPTMYGFHMRKMRAHGASGSTYEDEVLIIPGIGKNSDGYDAPLDESRSGE